MESGDHLYLLTIIVGKSDCARTDDYDKVSCPIVDADSSLRCDVVVDGDTHQLTDHQCDRAFDFKSICVGCPVPGSEEEKNAKIVAQYVVSDLTNKAAHAHVIRYHLGLRSIKKFVSEDDGEGGRYYSVEVSVGETNCSLDTAYSPDKCRVRNRETRLCSAEVHETIPQEAAMLARGVDIKRYEVRSTLCKDSHDTVNLERQATIEDEDVIAVAKMLTTQVGESFSDKIWLVSQIISANRFKVEDGVNYALTLRFTESNCPLSVAKDNDLNLLYNNGECYVNYTADSRYCQLLVKKQRITYRSLTSSPYQLSILEQVCAEQRQCPSDCDQQPLSPVCGSDGKMYPNKCYLQAAGCRRRSEDGDLVQSPDSVCARSQLQDNIICAGCPEEGSQENEEVRAAADFANIALTSHFNNTHYFALDSITNVKTQVSSIHHCNIISNNSLFRLSLAPTTSSHSSLENLIARWRTLRMQLRSSPR